LSGTVSLPSIKLILASIKTASQESQHQILNPIKPNLEYTNLEDSQSKTILVLLVGT